MKDDLPDLTPYLSKKGGNSQGKAADNSAGKTDISSKLSALVKKTGTLSGSDADAIVDSQSAVSEQIQQPSVGASDSASMAQSGNSAAASSSSWEQVDSFSSASSSVSAARLEAQAEALAQEKLFAQAAAGVIPEPTPEPVYSPSANDIAAASQSAPPAVADPAAGSNNDDSVSNSQSGTFSTSGNFSTSGTFATRPVASRPGGPAPSIDKFKAPQARPMNTLSSGAPPLLKVPEKEAVRSPAPYTFQQANEAPREAVVPKSMQLPTPSAPTSSAPGSSAQALRAAEIAKEPPPSWPAQPTAPPRIVEKIEKAERRVEPQPQYQPQPQSQYQAQPQPQSQYQPQPSARPQTPTESTSEILAKAFQEEAKALEQNSDDMLEPPSASVQSNFSSEADSQYDSPYFEPKPKGTVGFGSLLNAGSTAPDFGANPEPEQHSSLADLMIPTGEHQALFAPERRGDDGISPFDEVQPSGLSDGRQDNYGANLTSSADVGGQPDAPNPNAVINESVRVDEKAAAPAFSSLFSTEIVTSGQDYSLSDYKPNALDGDIQKADDYALTPEEPAAQSSGVLSQSDAISKLLEAVNKEQNNANPNVANNFAEQPFTEGNYSEPDDMRTADTMFGSGGSNKGSAEELSAADAVFGAVPDLVAPLPESSPPFNSSPTTTSSGSSSGFGSSSSSSSGSYFPEQPVLGKDSLPIAFANAENFEQESLESIKLGIRKAKAEEKARKKAEEEAKLAEAKFEEAQVAEAASAAPEVVERADTSRENLAEPIKSSEQQSPKSTAKLSLTEMIELANSAKLEQVQEGRPMQVEEQPAPAQSGLSSLLSAASYDQPVSKVADDEDDDGDSLGGAISDALDKLLAAGQEEQSQPVAAKSNDSTSFAEPSFADEPSFAPLSESVSSMPPPGRLESFASTPNQVEVDTPLTQTQANKVDALSRLLEVASKAPHKSPEDKRTPGDSASKIAAEINRPPGRVSRQVETIQPVDYNQQPGQGAAMSSPFGGSSPFSSPFNSPSSSQTGQASQGQSPTGSGSGSGMSNPYDGVSGMPQATVSNDAVSARIAALNRKLEEQNRPPSASAVNIDAMVQIQQQAEAQAQSQQSHVGTGTSPSVNSLSQLPPQVDDSPSTRAELVNRILGSAKISQHGTKMPELPTRTVAETITPEQTAAIRGGKGNSQGPPRSRARASRMPGVDLRPIMAIVVLLVVVGGGAFYAYQSGMIKFNLPDSKPGSEAKVSIDQMIKNGELDRARELLESKVNSGKITASEGEKLHSIYYQMANKVDDEDPSEAIKLLEKIPSRSKKYKDAQKLLRKLKKKVKKN